MQMQREVLTVSAINSHIKMLLQRDTQLSGLLVRGGEVNTERCAVMLVDEFRACKWGRISLERPPQRDDMADFAEEDEE